MRLYRKLSLLYTEAEGEQFNLLSRSEHVILLFLVKAYWLFSYFQPYKYELYPTRYSILCGHTRNLSALWKKRKTKIKRIKETFYQGNKVEF